MNNKTTTIFAPAGTYWVGDPCYAFDSHLLWMRLLESADYETEHLLDANSDGFRFAASGTAFGDGEYSDQYGRTYDVDAGMIGVTPAREGEATPNGMHKITFESEFTISYENDGGVITIGHLVIPTDEEPECYECGERGNLAEADLCWDCHERHLDEEAMEEDEDY